jgi:hypothetical protein
VNFLTGEERFLQIGNHIDQVFYLTDLNVGAIRNQRCPINCAAQKTTRCQSTARNLASPGDT